MRRDDTPLPVAYTENGALVKEDANELESDIEDDHDQCPECEGDYEYVTLYPSGTVQFVHENTGALSKGCSITDHDRITDDILP